MSPFDPHCRRCGGMGVVREKLPPGCEHEYWCTPCPCGQIDLEDFGPMLARFAAAGITPLGEKLKP